MVAFKVMAASRMVKEWKEGWGGSIVVGRTSLSNNKQFPTKMRELSDRLVESQTRTAVASPARMKRYLVNVTGPIKV